MALIAAERLVLFYAQSGAGKSSLINTRLIPQLQASGYAVLPIGRVQGDLPQGGSSVANIFVFNLMLSLDQSKQDPQRFAQMKLSDFLAGLTSADGEHYEYQVDLDENDEAYEEAPHVLIIDQFEEIITTNQERWPEREEFFRQLNQAMVDNPLLWVVLCLREDYIAAIEPYAYLLVDKMRARFYMQRMRYEAALEAVKRPAQLGGRPFGPGVAEILVDNLRQIRSQTPLSPAFEGEDSAFPPVQRGLRGVLGQYVEPVQLQVVCYQLWKNLKERPAGEITEQDLHESGNVEIALADFYDQVIQKTVEQSDISELELRNWFDQKLMTEAGTRGIVYHGPEDTAGLPNPIVKLLVDQFLLRAEIRNEETWYRLAHPRFIQPILQANQVWQVRQGQLPAEISHEDVRELGNVDTALAQFYEQAIAKVLQEIGGSEIELRNWFERQLITEAGTRGTVYQGQEKTGGLPNRTVELLANQFLLRAEIRAGGTWYELVHDRFIEPILQANQAWRLSQGGLVQAALAWDEAGRNEDNLYRGQALRAALAGVSGQQVEPLVAEFLAASEKYNQALEEQEARRQRELEQAQALAEAERRRAEEQARASRRLRRLVIALAVVFLVAVGAAMLARTQQLRAEAQEQEAIAAQETAEAEAMARATAQAQAEARRVEAEAAQAVAVTAQTQAEARRVEAEVARNEAIAARDAAERSALIARSGQLAAQAQAAMSDNYPQRSLLLAVEAMSITLQAGDIVVPAAQDTLWQALTTYGGLGLGEQEESIAAIAMSPDNRWLFTGSGAIVQGWDLTNSDAEPVVLAVQEGPIAAIAISPAPSENGLDNQWLVVAGGTTTYLWDLTNLAVSPTILSGHNDLITAMAISPDNRRLVTGSADLTIRIWDLTNLDSEPTILPVQEAAIADIAISSNNRWLVTTGFFDTRARIWDLTNLEADPITLSVQENPIEAIAISPDNQWLVAGSDDVYLWNLAASDPAATSVVLPGESFINALAISSNSRWLAVGTQDGTLQIWDLTDLDTQSGKVLKGHNGAITTLTLSATPSSDGHTWLASGGADRTVRLWDLANLSEEPVAVLRGHDEVITRIAISSDNHWLVTASADTTARLWDLTAASLTAAPLFLPSHEESPLTRVAISPDNRWLVTASEDATIGLWDVTSADALSSKSLAALSVIQSSHAGPITAMAVSPDSHWLITGSSDDTRVHLWDLQNGSDLAATPIILAGHEGGVTALAITPDSRWLATGSDDATVRLWDLQNAPTSTARPFLLSGHKGSISAIAISPAPSEDDPGSQWLATASGDGTVRLWDLPRVTMSTGPGNSITASVVLTGHEGWVNAVAISPDNRWLVSGDDSGVVRLWNLSTVSDLAAEPIMLPGSGASISAIAISPDNHWLVTIASADVTARLWDLRSVSTSATTPLILRGHQRSILAMAISPDSHWLVTGSFDGTARLWDLTAADPAATSVVLRSHTRSIVTVAISPDNHWLVTGSSDTTARLWTLRPDELVELACRTTGRNLTAAEWAQYFTGQTYRQTCASLPPSLSLEEGVN